MKKIKLLDCTLRDGAYIVNSMFGDAAIKGIISSLDNAGVEIIECGWLKNDEHVEGSSFYHVPKDLEQYINKRNTNVTYTVMIDWDRYNLDFLPMNDGKSVDAVRVVFPHGKHIEGMEVGKHIKDKGYQVFFQAANTLAYSDEDLISLAEEANRVMPVSLSVVDTFGAMYHEDLKRIVSVLDKHLDKNIALGFHSHNNQQLSFALSMYFVELLCDTEREIVVDSSLCGMGRGAGNATTELIVNYLNSKQGSNYDMDAVMDAIDVYMTGFSEKYSWGYSTPYFIAGMYCCHVNNIAYLTKNHRAGAKDMRNVIESLSPADRKKYDYDLLEQKFIENESRELDDTCAFENLKEKLCNKKIVLIAPGKTSTEHYEDVHRYISENDCIVIAVNALLPNYKYDYLFLTNSARYQYAKETKNEQFSVTPRILLSCIKRDGDKDETVINYNRAIKRGWDHFDNAVICILRLLGRLGIHEVAIAGFDGFKDSYNESYADEALPAVNPGKKWSELNDEIKDMYADVVSTQEMNVLFLTESIYE